MRPIRVGVLGCGNISGIYFRNLGQFKSVKVVSCADLDLDRARKAGAEWQVANAYTPHELFSDAEVDVVLNLTVPLAHAETTRTALAAGKHVYVEKPLGINPEEAEELCALAARNGLLLGCAPDTVLGAGIQTAREVVDSGRIGKPLAAQGFMLCHGHESWHPAPEFYYKRGGGPVFDMGPYYLSALHQLLGPVSTVTGLSAVSFEQRIITSEPSRGTPISVETPTHCASVLRYASGAVVGLTMSFDVFPYAYPHIVVFGTEGSMEVPDPNGFGGSVRVRGADDAWEEVPLRHKYSENARGIGVLDLANCIQNGGEPRCSGEIANHLVKVMQAMSSGCTFDVGDGPSRPTAMPWEGIE